MVSARTQTYRDTGRAPYFLSVQYLSSSLSNHFIAGMGTEMHIGYWWESRKERNHWEDRDVSGWTVLGWISERYDGMVWNGLIWLRIGTSGELL
jgi:hypothetical protein